MSEEIRFASLPEDKRGSTGSAGRAGMLKHQRIAAKLKERPGEWARVLCAVYPSNATAISTARIKAYAPAGAYEAVTRTVKDTGRFDIWARYVGDPS